MSNYRFFLKVTNTYARNIPARRVRIDLPGTSPTDALNRINTVWPSRDGAEVNASGVRFGYAYNAWTVDGKARKIGAVAE